MNKTILVLSFLMSTPAVARPPGFETHGGSAVVCRTSDGTPKSVKLLDSYEAKIRYGLTLFPENISSEDLYAKVDQRLAQYPLFRERINALVLHFYRVMLPVPDGHTLKKIEDINPIVMEDGCVIEQLAVFDEAQSVLLYRQSLFEKMSRRDQNALFLHEAIFSIARSDRNVADSTSPRHLTAMLISEWSQRNDDMFLDRQVNLVTDLRIEGKYREQNGSSTCLSDDSTIAYTYVDVKFDPKTRHLIVRFDGDQRCVGRKMVYAAPIELVFEPMSLTWNPVNDLRDGEWSFNLSGSTVMFSSRVHGIFYREEYPRN